MPASPLVRGPRGIGGRSAPVELPSAPVFLLVNALTMSGYEPEARSLFAQWNREHVLVVWHVAVVTRSRLWHVVVRAMGLASSPEMRPFGEVDGARAWPSREP